MADLKSELGRLVVDTTTRITGKVLSPQDQEKINEEAARQMAA
jgi:F-type H+-transporting ATPase subunit b